VITAPAYQGKTIGVFGLARTGIAAVEALVASGATVWAWDDSAERVAGVGAVAVDLYAADFAGLDALMIAPGVPLTHPVPHALVEKAKAANVPIIGDMDIFEAARAVLPRHKVVAITGTNGKSTTSALVAHILLFAGRSVALGGNIGTGVLSLEALADGGTYIFEVSSYQIDLMHSFSPDIAVLLNISPDHLDRHGSMAGYVRAKARLFDLLDSRALAVINPADRYCADITRRVKCPLAPIPNMADIVDMKSCPTLMGDHNRENAAVAYAICHALGLKDDEIIKGLQSFPGLAHRQEHVATSAGVLYVNDSKATNVEAAVKALASFNNIHWIAGGRSKEKGLDDLMPYLARVKAAYLIGEAANDFEASLTGFVPVHNVGTLRKAIITAAANAVEGDVVLLSPACAAFDQFENFEVRGSAFASDVMVLADGGDTV